MRSAAFVICGLVAGVPAAATDWRMYAGAPRRLFFDPAETIITAANVVKLHVKWTFLTGAIVSASPVVLTLDLPGEGRTAVAFIVRRPRAAPAAFVRPAVDNACDRRIAAP